MESVGQVGARVSTPPILPKEPIGSSYYRRVRNLVLLPWDYAATSWSSYRGAPNTDEAYYRHPAIKSLAWERQIATSAVVSYAETFGPSLCFIGDFMFKRNTDQIFLDHKEEVKERGQFYVAIPVVVSTINNHLVTFFIDLVRNRIEFYDPQGLTIRDRDDQPLLSHPNVNLDAFYRAIFPYYGDAETELYENLTKVQYDVHSCGVDVCRYIARRLAGEEPESISASGIETSAIRDQMIEKITKLYKGKTKN